MVLFGNAYLNDIYRSEDVVQEKFIHFWNDKLYENLNPKSLSSYLFTLVKNACLNQINKNDVLANSAELEFMDLAEEEATRIAEEGILKVKEALKELPEKTRQVVECVMIQNMKYKEAAEELDVSINTIKTLLQHGLKKLRADLKNNKDLFYLFFM